MAVDFMIMPLSRYLSGDFVTPAMTVAWQQGLPYSLFGPEGRRDIPQDTPFGGPDATANRERFVPMLIEDLKQLPSAIPDMAWDEASSAAPAFHRVDPESYEALLSEASAGAGTPPSLLGFLKRKAAAPSHVLASVFLPVEFAHPFDMPVVFERLAGSAQVALRELEGGHWSDHASSARDTLRDALLDAVRQRLPMIVDT